MAWRGAAGLAYDTKDGFEGFIPSDGYRFEGPFELNYFQSYVLGVDVLPRKITALIWGDSALSSDS